MRESLDCRVKRRQTCGTGGWGDEARYRITGVSPVPMAG